MTERANKETVHGQTDALPLRPHRGSGARPPAAGAIIAVLLLSVMAAYMATKVSFASFFLFVLTLLALAGAYRQPRIATVIFLIYTSSVIAPEYFSLWIDPNLIYWGAELLLLVIVIGAIVQRVREAPGAFQDFITSPIAVSLTVLGAVIVAKSIVFLVDTSFAQWAFNHVYTFNRSLGFLALFIPVFFLVNNAGRQRRFLEILYVMGVVIAVRVIIEAIFPDLYFFQWTGLKQPLAVDFPTVDPTILRLRAPGGSIVQVCFWMGMMNMILRPWNPRRLALFLPLTLLMLVAILLEFNRSYVIPIVVLIGVAMLLNQRAARMKLVSVLAFFAIIAVVLTMLTGSLGGYVEAFTDRYSSAFAEETFETQSLNSRMIENGYAWDSISRAPVFGIDIDELYRPSVAGMLDNLRWYIHNAYLWYWVYFGFIGLAALAVALSVAIVRGLLNWKKVGDPFLQAGVLSLVFTLVTLSAASFYAPRFYEYGTLPVVAVIIGLIEAIILASRREQAGAGAGGEPLPEPAGDRFEDE